jgi:cysteine dioxygenase
VKQSLKTLFARLDLCEAAIPLAELQAELKNTELASEDFQGLIAFDEKTYRRNLLHEGPAYHALVICWRPGQRSPIHDHSGSSCAVHVLDGIATETAFAQTAQGHVYATASADHPVGGLLGSFDTDTHQLSNLQPPGQDLITLHLYSPALREMKRFSLTDARVETFTEPINLFVEGAGI